VPKDKDGNDIVEDPEKPGELPEAAKKILDAMQEKLDKKDNPPVDSQPKDDPKKQYEAWREDTKKKMGWNDDQLAFHEQSIRAAQAPLVRDNALMKMRTSQKDFDKLEKAFMEEVGRYEKMGRTVDSGLAEELFYMVKGKELSAGRYTPEVPGSQPAKRPADAERSPRRMAPSYNASDPGTGGTGERDDASSKLSEVEKDYLDFVDKSAGQVGSEVSAEDYVKNREDIKNGKREIADHAVRKIEVAPGAGPADRDMAALWNRSAATRR